MKIATNIPALQAKISISKAVNATTSASGKLSSGLRINSAADDLAGMAISARMKMQIRGSSRAGHNTMDGISLVQTADGALQEVHDMLQRMRELSIQASNATYTQSDLEKIQIEIDELKDEINSVSAKTEFNKIKLFDGTADLHTMGINAEVVSITETVKTGEYKINLLKSGTNTSYVPGSSINNQLSFPSQQLSGKITFIEMEIEIFGSDTLLDTHKKLTSLAEKCGFVVTRSDDGASIKSIEAKEAGSKQTINISSDNNALLDALGINQNAVNTQGTDAEVELIRNSKDPSSVISDSATYTVDGNTVTILDIDNQRIVAELEATENPVEGYVANLRKEILDRWNIVDKTHDDIADLYMQINSLNNVADADSMADELLRLEELAIKTSGEAKDLMFEAVRLFPQLADYPTYGPELQNLATHDGHYVVDFFDNSNASIQGAKDKAAKGDLSGTVIDLGNAFAYGLGSKQGGGGVAGCSFEIVNSALNIVKDTMQQFDEVKECTINVSDGGLILQVGANEGMQMKLNISKVTTKTLDIDDLEINTYDKAQEAIMKCDYAIGRISSNRAMLGSYQNRLSYTGKNLSSIEFSLSKSLSTIQDADLATEMAEATRTNVLQQAGMFVLSQANQKPQELLQLLK